MNAQKIKKIINVVLKVVLCLLIVTPILGAFGIFPQPTRDLYNTDIAFEFINILMQIKYINYIISIVFLLAILLIITKRTALAILLILPISVNIIAFHAFLDGGLFTPGAIMGNILFLINIYFLWQNRELYSILFKTSKNK